MENEVVDSSVQIENTHVEAKGSIQPDNYVPVDTSKAAEQATQVNFIDMLNDNLKADPSILKFKDVNALAEGYVNASKLIGKRADALSAEDIKGIVPEETLARILLEKGVPEKAEDYKLELHDLPVSENALSQFLGLAHDLKLPNETVQKLADWQTHVAITERESWLEDGRVLMGKDYDKAVNGARSVVKEYFDKEDIDFLNQSGMGDHPSMLKLLYKIHQGMQETPVIQPNSSNAVQDSSAIEAEINSLRSNEDFMKAWRSGSAKAAAQIENLYKRRAELQRR